MATTWAGLIANEGQAGYIKPTGASIPSALQGVYDKNLLERALPLLLHDKFGQKRTLPRKSGKTMVFRRYETMSVATTPLTEGTTPSGADLTKSEVVATIAQYGNFTQTTDLLETIGLDDIIMEATTLLGENMGESLDTIFREILVAGTSYTYVTADDAGTPATGTSNRNTVKGVLNKYAIEQAINILERNKAKKFTGLIQGAPKENTWPVAPSYWCIIHPDMVRDLYATAYSTLTPGSDFIPVEQYANQTQVMEGEVGKFRCVRFIATTQSKIWTDTGYAVSGLPYRSAGTKCDVYSALFLGRDAYGIVPLDGLNSRSIVHRAGSSGTSDPLNQRSTIAWKAATTAVILNDAFMHRVECASLA